MRLSILIMSLLAIIVSVGSYCKLEFVPYLVSLVVISVIILIALKKLPQKTYPVYLVGLSAIMILQQTMLGTYIVGTDIHQEYFMAQKAIATGWDWSYYSLNGTSIILNVVAPLLDKIGIPVLWQFKLVYPLVLSFVPLVLYLAFTKQISKQLSFYASLFFMIVPVFTVEIATITKSMVAELFMGLVVLTLFSNISNFKKFAMICLFGVLCILCHYTIGTLVVGYLGVMGILLIIYKLITRKDNYLPVVGALIVVLIMGAIWFINTGGGIVYIGYANSYTNIAKITGDVIQSSTNRISSHSDEINIEKAKTNYLDQQNSLVKTALGMDWNKVDLSGKLFRVFQYITQLAIILGAIFLVIKRKQYNISIEFIMGVLASVIILLVVLFVPSIATIINTTRWYHSALFFASPLLVIGLFHIGKERLIVGILLIYYIFTSGLYFTLTNEGMPEKTIQTPYSIAFNWKQGVIGIFNDDDINCAKWLVPKLDGKMVQSGFTDMYLFMGYVEYNGQFVEQTPSEPHYVFISSQNAKIQKMTTWTEPGMRKLVLLPDISGMEEVYRSGNSVVYYGQ